MNQQRMLREWNRFHGEQLQLALDGDSGTVVKNIMILVRGLTPQRMPELLRLMRSVDWRIVDADVRFTLLHEINGAIIELREQEGRTRFDDALPFSDERPSLFLIVRDMLSGSEPGSPPDDPA